MKNNTCFYSNLLDEYNNQSIEIRNEKKTWGYDSYGESNELVSSSKHII